ncbi:MAG TPA: redoxin domain-containing protein [Phycisphaerae bacterium]
MRAVARCVAVPVLAVGLTVLAVRPALAEDEKKPTAEVGKPAPSFTLKNYDGKDISLKDYAGKVVILEWFNNECPYIQGRHGKNRDINAEVMKQFAGKPVVWIAIDSTKSHDPAHNQKVAEDWKIKFPILSDSEGTVGRSYGASSTPHMFVIDTKGALSYKGALDDDPQAEKGEKARNYVVQAVSALLNGSNVETSSTRPYGCGVKYAAAK